jgi:hypothetical protein
LNELNQRVKVAGDQAMQMNIALQPLAALIGGILILMIPRLLNYIIAIYLIIIGILGLAHM